jgi:aldehyde:ferredoxin oxidoreductase
MAWQGQVLRVNLTKGTSKIEPLNMKWAHDYMGLRGLGTKYYVEEVDPKVDALSPENKLIFATGPLTGTMASTGGRYGVITKGALTGAIACSNSGGKWGAELKFAGFDLLIVEGKAKKPVYLYIEDEKVEIRPADGLWGQTVWETEKRIHERHGDHLIRVASIGPAGEYGCRFACVVNDLHRAAGRSGVGAVMGSKNLKCVAIKGSKGVPVKDLKKFMAVVAEKKKMLAENEDRKGLTRFGTNSMMDVVGEYGSLPTRNERDSTFEGYAKISATAMQTPNANGHTNLITNSACFACTIGCGRVARIDPKHFSVKDRPEYQVASGGLEYETAFAVGAMVGVDDIDASTFAGFMCNAYGMDPISLGGSISAAMELYETGAIGPKQTGNIDLRFGNAEALVLISEMIGKGEGFGKEIGMGSRLLCEKYKHPEFSITVKGQEFAGYDPRAMQGMGLGYATSNRGACHLKADPFADDFKRVATEGKAKIVKESQDVIAGIDSTGCCLFTSVAWGPKDYAEQIAAATGMKLDEKRFHEIGERIWNLERQFNLKAGITAKDDTLPKRVLTEPSKVGAGKGWVNKLGEMLPEYYTLRGWNDKGVPTKETLSRLGL